LLDEFSRGTNFDEVLALYTFDRRLKDLVWSGLERVEVAFRSRIGHVLGEYGPLAHTDSRHFRSTFDHHAWWRTAQRRINRARGRDVTVDHHDQVYAGDIPLWVLTDLLDFSDVSKLYAGMRSPDQRIIAEWFGVSMAADASKASRRSWNKNPPLANWLENLTTVRNICAHHGRLWNRQLVPLGIPQRIHHLRTFEPLIATFETSRPDQWQSERVFGTICVIDHLLQATDPAMTWRADLDELVDTSFPAKGQRDITEMGFPRIARTR
jgi:abortive infection bacteriophage resistance protein